MPVESHGYTRGMCLSLQNYPGKIWVVHLRYPSEHRVPRETQPEQFKCWMELNAHPKGGFRTRQTMCTNLSWGFLLAEVSVPWFHWRRGTVQDVKWPTVSDLSYNPSMTQDIYGNGLKVLILHSHPPWDKKLTRRKLPLMQWTWVGNSALHFGAVSFCLFNLWE